MGFSIMFRPLRKVSVRTSTGRCSRPVPFPTAGVVADGGEESGRIGDLAELRSFVR